MLINKIKDDMWAAKKSKNTLEASLLNTLLGESEKVGKDAGNRLTTDDEVIAVIKKFLKNNKELLDVVTNMDARRQAFIEQTILESYLPKQLSDSELLSILTDHRNTKLLEVGEAPTMGEYMKLLKDHHAGLYDGKLASEIAKKL